MNRTVPGPSLGFKTRSPGPSRETFVTRLTTRVKPPTTGLSRVTFQHLQKEGKFVTPSRVPLYQDGRISNHLRFVPSHRFFPTFLYDLKRGCDPPETFPEAKDLDILLPFLSHTTFLSYFITKISEILTGLHGIHKQS